MREQVDIHEQHDVFLEAEREKDLKSWHAEGEEDIHEPTDENDRKIIKELYEAAWYEFRRPAQQFRPRFCSRSGPQNFFSKKACTASSGTYNARPWRG